MGATLFLISAGLLIACAIAMFWGESRQRYELVWWGGFVACFALLMFSFAIVLEAPGLVEFYGLFPVEFAFMYMALGAFVGFITCAYFRIKWWWQKRKIKKEAEACLTRMRLGPNRFIVGSHKLT